MHRRPETKSRKSLLPLGSHPPCRASPALRQLALLAARHWFDDQQPALVIPSQELALYQVPQDMVDHLPGSAYPIGHLLLRQRTGNRPNARFDNSLLLE